MPLNFKKMPLVLLLPLLALSIGLPGCSVKPELLTEQDLLGRIAADRKALYEDQVPLTSPLSLADAIARALTYNYDHRASMMELVFQFKQIKIASYDMLPKLAATAGYTTRSNNLASFSTPVDVNSDQGNFVTSQDRSKAVADLAFTWNILDFGVSYYQAKQQADRFLIAQERRRRVINNIIGEVVGSYWRSYTAQQLLPAIKVTLDDAQDALRANREIERQRLQPLMLTLQNRKNLLRLIDQLQDLSYDLRVSRTQLASLINLPLQHGLVIAPSKRRPEPPRLAAGIKLADLENIGLYNRPDLRELVYQDRIDRHGVRKEILRMFPGLSVSASENYDSNSFLMNNTWAEAGARVTQNLLDLITGPAKIDAAKTKIEMGRIQRLALSVAALVQINIAYEQYHRSVESYKLSSSLNQVEMRLNKVMADAGALKARSALEQITQQAAAIASQLERDLALANIIRSLSNLYISLGCDLYTGPLGGTVDLPTLTARIEDHLGPWQMGQIVSFPTFPSRARHGRPSAATDQ